MQSTKREALLAVAQAYYDRGDHLQYDQRSMDRVLQLTPRRRRYLPPEAATGQYTLYLDCSAFTFAAYYQTFGAELEADLTWHIIDYVEPRVYYYELTHRESPEALAAIERELRALLQPGDLITVQWGKDSGHVMLYVDEETYLNCSQNGVEGSYDFVNRRNRFRETGAMWIEKVDWLFAPKEDGSLRNCLFDRQVQRFAVSRPLDRMGEPTPAAIARITSAKALLCGVETSHPGARQAAVGETATYYVSVKNTGREEKPVYVTFAAPEGARCQDTTERNASLPGGAEERFRFSVRVEAADALWLDPPAVTVNALPVYAPRVLLGKPVSEEQLSAVNSACLAGIRDGKPVMQAAAEAYAQFGVAMEARNQRYLFTHFCLHDAPPGDVLSRRPQTPGTDLAVYGLFGGVGVITPEMCMATGVRATQIDMRDLMPGDIVLCSDDPYGNRSYACYYTGRQIIGSTECDEAARPLSAAETAAYLDSLPGRFCYLVLRPFWGLPT